MKFSYLSDVGQVRQNNEDYVWAGINKYNNFAGIVCDGLGGYKGGSAASEIMVSVFREQFKNIDFNNYLKEDVINWVNSIINNAREKISKKILENEQLKNMATTAVFCICIEHKAYIFNVGDSRAWFISNSDAYQVTTDQNLYNYLVKINADKEVFEFHQDNLYAITQFIGKLNEKKIIPDCFELKVNKGDYIVLTSDGCHNFINLKDIVNIINKERNIDDACRSIILNSLANNSNDNLSIVIMEF